MTEKQISSKKFAFDGAPSLLKIWYFADHFWDKPPA